MMLANSVDFSGSDTGLHLFVRSEACLFQIKSNSFISPNILVGHQPIIDNINIFQIHSSTMNDISLFLENE